MFYKEDSNYADFRISVISNCIEKVKQFLSNTNNKPEYQNNVAIRMASENGHIEIVKLLLKDDRVDPTSIYNQSLSNAAAKGHLDIVELLLNDSRVILNDPESPNNYAMKLATQNKHNHIVKLLHKDGRMNPAYCGNEAITVANNQDNQELVDLFWSDKRVKDTLKEDRYDLYNKLIQKDIKNKIKNF
jgi:ankyrin repeat protein